MGVLDSPWEDQPSHVRLREFIRRLLSASFRREVRARQARDAELLVDRLDVGTRLFVRDLYNEQLADQDEYRLKPDLFADAVREWLSEALLNQPDDVDEHRAWRLLEAALAERARWISTAQFGRDQAQHPGRDAPRCVQRFEFLILVEGEQCGNVTYTVCIGCGHGVLDNITVDAPIGCAGVGRRALDELQRRWTGFEFNTTGQRSTAKGFYDRYRTTSPSPWRPRRDGCPHLASWYGLAR